jgi:hypothetical protein
MLTGYVLENAVEKDLDDGLTGRGKDNLLKELNTGHSPRQIEAVIERLSISADAKSLLLDISRITMKVGNALFSLGKAILTFVINTVKKFPNTTFGLVIGLTVSVMVGGIPVIGFILGPLLGKLLTAFGLTMGAIADFKDASIRSEIAALERKVAIVAEGA